MTARSLSVGGNRDYNRRPGSSPAMHFESHQPIINDLEARILTIRDSL